MSDHVTALAAIVAANLSDKTHATATRLLALAHPDNGHITLSWAAALDICRVETRGSVWRFLGAMKKAGIIHYSTNEMVDITFEAWRGDADRRVDAQPAARGRAKNATPIGLVGIETITPSGKSCLNTNQPEGVDQPASDEQQRSLALLTDPEVGLSEKQARRLATTHQFHWIVRQVFAFLDDQRTGKVSSTGALVSRLDRKFAPGELTQRDRASALYRRHVSEEEDFRQHGKNYTPSEYADLIIS
jgi:hypothetical protein